MSKQQSGDYWQTEGLDIVTGSASVGHVVLNFLLFFVLMLCCLSTLENGSFQV